MNAGGPLIERLPSELATRLAQEKSARRKKWEALAVEKRPRLAAPPPIVPPPRELCPDLAIQFAEAHAKLRRVGFGIGSNGRPTVHGVKRVVAQSYGVSIAELDSMRRWVSITWPRQIAMHLASKLTGASLPHIGRRFGNRDHTTVLHAVRKVDAARQADRALDNRLLKLSDVIRREAEAYSQDQDKD